MRTAGFSILLIVTCFLTGCNKILVRAKPPQGHYYLNPRKDFSSVNRVLLMELENHSAYTEMSELMTRALANGLSKKHLFTIRTIHRSDPLWTTLDLDNITTYSYEEMVHIQKTLEVDAIVFGTIKQYQSFPHLLMSLHLKMVHVNEGQLLWAIEQVWDSTDREVGLRMKKYYSKRTRDGFQPLDWTILVNSPRAFNKFIVDEVGDTLPELSSMYLQPTVTSRIKQYF